MLVIFRAELFKIEFFQVIFGLGGMHIILPGTSEELIDIVM